MSRFGKIMKKFGVTEAQCIELRRAMAATWDAVASDSIEAAADDKRLRQKMIDEQPAIVAELTLDAGRYRMYGGQPLEWLGLWMAAGGDLLKLGAAVWKV